MNMYKNESNLLFNNVSNFFSNYKIQIRLY